MYILLETVSSFHQIRIYNSKMIKTNEYLNWETKPHNKDFFPHKIRAF